MDNLDLQRAVAAMLFAAGEAVPTQRMADAAGVPAEDVREAAEALMDRLGFERAGIRVVRLEDAYQMCSSGEFADMVARVLETRKPPRLSTAQLETLTVIAYYQPATKAYVEQLRGVDSSYSIGALLNKKLIEEAGRLNVPGRPILYRTTPAFLRTFGLTSLEELPPMDRTGADAEETQLALQDIPEGATP